MISDAYVRVECDDCSCEDEVELTATVRGWDDRNVKSWLERNGWVILGEYRHVCEDCHRMREKDK